MTSLFSLTLIPTEVPLVPRWVPGTLYTPRTKIAPGRRSPGTASGPGSMAPGTTIAPGTGIAPGRRSPRTAPGPGSRAPT
jgi:hypothetical protein